jgi:hypothetical protein
MKDSDNLILDHLDCMTDSKGLIQHAIYNIPRRKSGYTTDDNARALRLCTALWGHHPQDRMSTRITKYLSFLEYARCPGRGFHNFMSYEGAWLDAEGCGDCQGQATRALAEVLASNLPEDYRMLARELIEGILPTLADLRSLRAQAYIILAWGHLWMSGVKDLEVLESVAWSAAHRLLESYSRSLRPDWLWFELRMTYANGILPHAMFVAAKRWPKEGFFEVGETSFAFLDRMTTEGDFFWPVGNNGWYPHTEQKAPYDQQPIEASIMADAALSAFGMTNDSKYLESFFRARDWFHGRNSLGQTLVDAPNGACRDGLQPSGVNRNQGAESMLAYLWTEFQYSKVQQLLNGNQKVSITCA